MLYRWKWDSLHVSGRSLNRSWLFKHTYTQTNMQRCQHKISYNTIFVDYGGVSRFLIINAKFVLINPSPPEGKSPLHLNKLGLVIHKPPTYLPMGRDFSLATSQWGEMVRLGLGHPFKTVQNLTFSTIEHQLNKNNCRGGSHMFIDWEGPTQRLPFFLGMWVLMNSGMFKTYELS